MITFDQNGVATRESQAFFEQKKLSIITDSRMTDSGKASALGDLYNLYGMEFGTYKRRVLVHQAKDDEPLKYYNSTDSSLSGLAWTLLFFMVVFGIAFLDQWFSTKGIHIGYIQGVERLFVWLFSSH